MASEHKKKRFCRAMIIYSAVLTVIMAVLLTLLWSFLKQYELSRPEYAMDRFIEAFDADYRKALLDSDPISVSEFESKSAVYDYILKSLEAESYRYIKAQSDNNGEKQFTVYGGSKAAARVTLAREAKKRSFGFKRWNVSSASLIYSASAYTFTAPSEAKVSINNVAADGKYIAKTTQHPPLSEFETCDFAMNEYRVELYTVPSAAAFDIDGNTLPIESNTGGNCVFVANTMRVVLCIPSDASLKINGKPVSSSYITNNNVPYTSIHKAEASLAPHRVEYTVGKLTDTPEVIVTSASGETLEPKENNGQYVYGKTIDITVYAPLGSVVSANGVTLDKNDLTETAEYDILKKAAANSIKYDMYVLTGLVYQPDISATLSGTALTSYYSNEQCIKYDCASAVENKALFENAAKNYTLSYIAFSSGGRKDTQAHFDALAEYMVTNTETYNKLKSAVISLQWTAPFNIDYIDTNIGDYIFYGSGYASCTVKFEAKASRGSNFFEYNETFRLVITVVNGKAKILYMDFT